MQNIRFCFFKPNSLKVVYFVAFIFFCLCFVLFYPGMFSNDGISQWHQATTNTYTDWHPIIMAVLMHELNPLLGCGGIFVIHQFFYWIAIALLVELYFGQKAIFCVIGFFPPIFMQTLSVFKDTGMAVAFLLSLLCFVKYQRQNNPFFLITSIVFLLYGTLVRTNGILISVILLITMCLCNYKKAIYLKTGTTLFVFFVLTYLSNFLLTDAYKPIHQDPIPTLMLWDVAGTYKNAGVNESVPSFIQKTDHKKASQWLRFYHADSCIGICWFSGLNCNLETSYQHEQMVKFWLKTIRDYPEAYISHRIDVVTNLWGIRSNIYYPYHNYSQNNLLSDTFHVSHNGKKIFDWLDKKIWPVFEKLYLCQPIVYIVVSLLIITVCIRRALLKVCSRNIFPLGVALSSLANALSLTLIAVAADYRYMIWSLVGSLFSLIILIYEKTTIEDM